MSVDSLNNQLPDQSQQKIKKPGLFKKKTREEKIEITCKKALKNATRGRNVWFLLLLISLIGIAYVIVDSGFEIFKTQNFEKILGFILIFAFILLVFNRFLGNLGISKRLRGRKKYYKQLPTESNILMRELYLFYCRRRCVHYWISLIFSCLFALVIMYILVAVGVDAAASKGEPKNLKIWENLSDLQKWKWHQKAILSGAIGIVLTWLQYFIFRTVNDKKINALEERYGREKIIHESIYCFRMSKVNFRYKTATFIIVCLTGCLFYLLFKRLICTIFEKSCVI